jgi:hypothetical protein
LLVWSSDGFISFKEIFNCNDGPIDDIPHALVLWSGGIDRLVENLRLKECWIASRRQRSQLNSAHFTLMNLIRT